MAKSNQSGKVLKLKTPPKRKVDRNCSHLSGEYFAAAELSRRGFNVAMTVGNAKKVDIIAECNQKTLPIQVKAIAHKRNVGWPINLNHKYQNDLIFIFVVLGDVEMMPEYYLLTGGQVQKLRKNYRTRSILNRCDVQAFRDNWGLIDQKLKAGLKSA